MYMSIGVLRIITHICGGLSHWHAPWDWFSAQPLKFNIHLIRSNIKSKTTLWGGGGSSLSLWGKVGVVTNWLTDLVIVNHGHAYDLRELRVSLKVYK